MASSAASRLLPSTRVCGEEHVLDGALAAGVEGVHGAVEEAERRGDATQLLPVLLAQPVDHQVQVDVGSRKSDWDGMGINEMNVSPGIQ